MRPAGLCFALGLVVLLGCDTSATDQTAEEPKHDTETGGKDYPEGPDRIEPRLSKQEIVQIRVGRGGLEFCPPAGEPAVIYFYRRGEGPEPGLPNQVEWLVSGLDAKHTLHITPKEGSSEEIFRFPKTYNGRPAFTIPGEFDSIVSGPAIREKATELFERKREVHLDEASGYHYVVWRYNVTVVDSEGKVVAEYDPEVRIKMHPP